VNVRQTLLHFLQDGCVCYFEGYLVVYPVSEFDFVRGVVAYVCLCVILPKHLNSSIYSVTLFATTILLRTHSITLEYQFCFSSR